MNYYLNIKSGLKSYIDTKTFKRVLSSSVSKNSFSIIFPERLKFNIEIRPYDYAIYRSEIYKSENKESTKNIVYSLLENNFFSFSAYNFDSREKFSNIPIKNVDLLSVYLFKDILKEKYDDFEYFDEIYEYMEHLLSIIKQSTVDTYHITIPANFLAETITVESESDSESKEINVFSEIFKKTIFYVKKIFDYIDDIDKLVTFNYISTSFDEKYYNERKIIGIEQSFSKSKHSYWRYSGKMGIASNYHGALVDDIYQTYDFKTKIENYEYTISKIFKFFKNILELKIHESEFFEEVKVVIGHKLNFQIFFKKSFETLLKNKMQEFLKNALLLVDTNIIKSINNVENIEKYTFLELLSVQFDANWFSYTYLYLLLDENVQRANSSTIESIYKNYTENQKNELRQSAVRKTINNVNIVLNYYNELFVDESYKLLNRSSAIDDILEII